MLELVLVAAVLLLLCLAVEAFHRILHSHDRV